MMTQIDPAAIPTRRPAKSASGPPYSENQRTFSVGVTDYEVTYHEEAGYNSTDCIRRVDCSNNVGSRMVVVGNPMLRVLESVEDGSIVTVEHHA